MAVISTSDFPELDPRFPAPVVFDGQPYPSAENAFRASMYRDQCRRARIARMTAAQAAYRGSVGKPDVPGWDPADAMCAVTLAKFSDPDMRRALRSTGTSRIVFTNLRHDNLWGTCTCPRCQGKGRNLLGRILEQVRDSRISATA